MSTTPSAERRAENKGWVRQAIARAWRAVNARERDLWVLVVGVLFVDFGLTVYGFQLGFVERNPLARSLISSFGVPAILALKGGALAIAAVLRPVMPDEYGAMVPLTLAISWGYAVVVNTVLITSLLV